MKTSLEAKKNLSLKIVFANFDSNHWESGGGKEKL
jgi:hypothetical protein